MDYATYSNLVREGNIIIEINSRWSVSECAIKPDRENWNGKVVILDYDTDRTDDENLTEVTSTDGTKYQCYFSEW